MKRFILLFVVVTGSTLLLTDCRHETILPEEQVSFSADIMPVIQSGCQHDGCHGTVNTNEFELLNYDDVMDHGEVKAGKPKDSKLYEVISGLDDDFMPAAPYPALSKRNVKLIYIWIAQGAKNN